MSEGIRWIKKRKGGKKERKHKKNERKKQTEREREREREREGREKQKREIFPALRRLELDGLRRKVDPHITSYAWVPKSWSFVKLHKVSNFPTLNIFSLKVMSWNGLSSGR